MIHRNDIGRPIAIMRADQIKAGDDIVVDERIGSFEGMSIERVAQVKHVGDDVEVFHTRDGMPSFDNFTTSQGNAVIVVR